MKLRSHSQDPKGSRVNEKDAQLNKYEVLNDGGSQDLGTLVKADPIDSIGDIVRISISGKDGHITLDVTEERLDELDDVVDRAREYLDDRDHSHAVTDGGATRVFSCAVCPAFHPDRSTALKCCSNDTRIDGGSV